ncbi:MAG TPA: aminoglycoside 3-N-acetyltransferase [Solirubrobacteraceae bacterium]|nr:aminoglycoside 3-N-acetyltransferase [Solirubrobacteraceae bacterium]
MPRPEHIAALTPVTRSRLVADLQRLGVRRGAIAMVHASLSALGWIVGGSQTVVDALLTTLGHDGTLCAQASWEDIPFGHANWPDDWRTAYEAEFPPFDPELSAAAPYEGRLAERIRTWPGAHRSANPAAGIAAIGARAGELTAAHRLDDGFGAGTPYARIVAAGGQIVLLGAPLRTISLLHHAESIARAPKRWTTYRLPLRTGWTTIRELDVWTGVYPDGPLDAIAEAALAAGAGRRGPVGASTSHVFEAAELTRFAVAWLEERFGASAAPSA